MQVHVVGDDPVREAVVAALDDVDIGVRDAEPSSSPMPASPSSATSPARRRSIRRTRPPVRAERPGSPSRSAGSAATRFRLTPLSRDSRPPPAASTVSARGSRRISRSEPTPRRPIAPEHDSPVRSPVGSAFASSRATSARSSGRYAKCHTPAGSSCPFRAVRAPRKVGIDRSSAMPKRSASMQRSNAPSGRSTTASAPSRVLPRWSRSRPLLPGDRGGDDRLQRRERAPTGCRRRRRLERRPNESGSARGSSATARASIATRSSSARARTTSRTLSRRRTSCGRTTHRRMTPARNTAGCRARPSRPENRHTCPPRRSSSPAGRIAGPGDHDRAGTWLLDGRRARVRVDRGDRARRDDARLVLDI